MKYTIYAEHLPAVRKKLDKLAAKAGRYGVRFGYTVGAKHPQRVETFRVDKINHTVSNHPESSYVVPAVDIEVDCAGLVCASGWTVCAHLEHLPTGNIVSAINGAEILPEWWTIPGRCDHCATNRTRRYTYIVRNNHTGELRQVGKACLLDYTGIDPATVAAWAEVRDLLVGEADDLRNDTEKKDHMFLTADVLAVAADMISRYGYVKKDEPGSTFSRVAEKISSGHVEPTEAGKATAAAVASWLTTAENLTDLEQNCLNLVRAGWCELHHMGRLVYMPAAYQMMMERKTAGTGSEYVGEVKQRLELDTHGGKLLTSWPTAYGTTFLYKFLDAAGNVLIWPASCALDVAPSGIRRLKATVKAHKERDGVKQTIITRCKICG